MRTKLIRQYSLYAFLLSICVILVIAVCNFSLAKIRRWRLRRYASTDRMDGSTAKGPTHHGPSSSASSVTTAFSGRRSSNSHSHVYSERHVIGDVQTSSARLRKTMLIVWVLGVMYPLFAGTGYDLQHLVKRAGRVSVAVLPAIYLLALKPSPFPNTFYLDLLPLHKWFSRLTFVIMLGHGILYVYIYAGKGKLFKLLAWKNVSGIVALLFFLAMGMTSLSPVRRVVYRLFYGIHYVLAWAVVPLVWYHCQPPANEYIYVLLGILGFQTLYRIFHTRHSKLRVQFMSNSLYLVSVPKKDMPRSYLPSVDAPGSHLRVCEPLWKPSTWVQSSHPYTIASLPHEDPVQLVIRKSTFPVKLRHLYGLMGPFRSVSDDFLDAVRYNQIRRVLFVVGGSGVAFAAPLLRYLYDRGVEVKLLWAIRDSQDVTVLKSIGLHEAVMRGDVEVHFTQRHTPFGAAPMVEAQMYNYNDDEDLDVAVDDLCCMDAPGPRTRFGSFVSDSLGSDYPFALDGDTDNDGEEAISDSYSDEAVSDELPLLNTSTSAYTNPNYGSHLNESEAFQRNPGAFICNPNADSSYVCTRIEADDENCSMSANRPSTSDSSGVATSTDPSTVKNQDSFTLAPVDKSEPYVASSKLVECKSSPPTSPKAPMNFTKTRLAETNETGTRSGPRPQRSSSSVKRRKSSAKFNDIRDAYGFAMFNSRPVLNIRLKLWLCGLSTNNDECCCVDQLITVSPEQRKDGWVISAGTKKLVNETRAWAKKNKFPFYQEEFTL